MMNKKLVILGGGESGVGAALLGLKLGYQIFLSDKGVLAEKYSSVLDEKGIAYESGIHTEERILNADLVIKSPGIPDNAPLILQLKEKGVEVISEIEFAGRHTDAKMLCITGSNGKTTTTLLLYHILKNAGFDVGLAGNVGHSLAAQVAENAHSMYVVELSSFQLDGMFDFKCDTAVIMNITPDHLDRYNYVFQNYVNSKFRILNNMDSNGLFIYCYDSEVVRNELKNKNVDAEVASFTFNDDTNRNAYLHNNILVVNYGGKSFKIDKNDLTIKGRHNIYNAMAAILACMKEEVDFEAIRKGLMTFPQVEHRLETVATIDGVVYINDSKATNADSTWYALDSMTTPVVWIAGGTDKGNDYSVLTELVRNKVKVLVCMGKDNKKLVDYFTPICKVEDTHSLDDAMKAVREHAEKGDTVLLSPCCASFDLFKNYEDRGRQFKSKVLELSKQ